MYQRLVQAVHRFISDFLTLHGPTGEAVNKLTNACQIVKLGGKFYGLAALQTTALSPPAYFM